MMASLARELQDLSGHFRKAQSSYLRKMRGQEERVKGFKVEGMDINIASDEVFAAACFLLVVFSESHVVLVVFVVLVLVSVVQVAEAAFDRGFNEQQQDFLRSNTARIQQRDEEILGIVRSINELATIFKELSILIVDQVRKGKYEKKEKIS